VPCRLALQRGRIVAVGGLGLDRLALHLAPVLDRAGGVSRRLLDLVISLFVCGHLGLLSLPMVDNRPAAFTSDCPLCEALSQLM
jgi:hypothetical protein